jgi:hypothetical protein
LGVGIQHLQLMFSITSGDTTPGNWTQLENVSAVPEFSSACVFEGEILLSISPTPQKARWKWQVVVNAFVCGQRLGSPEWTKTRYWRGEQAYSSLSCNTDVSQKLTAHVESPDQVPNTWQTEVFATPQVIKKRLRVLQKHCQQFSAFSQDPRKVYRGCKIL